MNKEKRSWTLKEKKKKKNKKTEMLHVCLLFLGHSLYRPSAFTKSPKTSICFVNSWTPALYRGTVKEPEKPYELTRYLAETVNRRESKTSEAAVMCRPHLSCANRYSSKTNEQKAAEVWSISTADELKNRSRNPSNRPIQLTRRVEERSRAGLLRGMAALL